MLLIKLPNGQLTLKREDGKYTDNVYEICKLLQKKFDELRTLPEGMYATHIVLVKLKGERENDGT